MASKWCELDMPKRSVSVWRRWGQTGDVANRHGDRKLLANRQAVQIHLTYMTLVMIETFHWSVLCYFDLYHLSTNGLPYHLTVSHSGTVENYWKLSVFLCLSWDVANFQLHLLANNRRWEPQTMGRCYSIHPVDSLKSLPLLLLPLSKKSYNLYMNINIIYNYNIYI